MKPKLGLFGTGVLHHVFRLRWDKHRVSREQKFTRRILFLEHGCQNSITTVCSYGDGGDTVLSALHDTSG